MMADLVIASLFGNIVGNGWQWASSHPLGAIGIVLGAVLIVCLLAGTAGVLPVALATLTTAKGLATLAAYLGLGLLLGSGVVCGIGSRGVGPGGTGEAQPPRDSGSIKQLIVVSRPQGSLDVEIKYRGARPPDRRTWNRQNLDGEVQWVCGRVPAGEDVVDVRWVDVPTQLQETVIEAFRRQGKSVSEEVGQP